MTGYLTPKQAAYRCHLTILTLATYRKQGRGPRWIRVGNRRGRILYDAQDVSRWLAERLGTQLHVDASAATDAARYAAAAARVEARLATLGEVFHPCTAHLRRLLWELRAWREELDRALEVVARIQRDLTPEGLERRAFDLASGRRRATPPRCAA